MYRIVATNPDGASYVIYDPVGSGPLPVLAPRITEELNEAGSLEFSLVYGHPAFEALHPKQTYFTATLDGNELFYGRLLSAEPSPLGGQIQCVVAGALSFLQDGEMAPDPKNDDGSYNFRTMTAEAFFRRCISEFNSEINNDPRRMFYVGIVSHQDQNKEREYQINSYTNFNEVIRQNIIDRYGGFLRVRSRPAGGHFIDWVEQYGTEDNAVLSIGQNILSIANRMEGEDLITAIRPVGKDGLVLSGSGTLDIFPNDLMAKYGKIVRSVQLGAAENESELSSQAQALIAAMHKTVPKTSEISMVDLHFADSNNHGVYLGDVFNHIAGLEGERMTVATRNRDCENPQNDSVTLKNAKMLEGSYDISDYKSNRSSGYSTGSDTLSRQTARAGGGAGMAYKYIHETQDRLELATKHIAINAEELELHADMFIETANEFARLSHVTGTLETEIGVIEGTGVIQNSEFITSLAGQFQYDPNNHTVSLISGTELRIMKSGAYITVGERLSDLTDQQARFEGSALWTQRNAITSVVGEFDVITGADGRRSLKVKSGTEFKIVKDGAEITVGDRITDLTTNMSTVTGSALWTQRNAITGVVGEFEVVTDGSGRRTLKVKSGGGLLIERNGATFGVYDSGSLTAGVIVNKINGGEATIQASKIYLLGDTIANTVSADFVRTKIAAIPKVSMVEAYASKLSIGTNITLANGLILEGNAVWQVSISQSGNTYTLKETKLNGTERTIGSFSRATTLAGAWSGGIFTVTASPQSKTISAGLFSVAASDITWNGNTASFPVYANLSGGETKYSTGKTMSIDATARYNAGVTYGVAASVPSRVTLGTKMSGTAWTVSIARDNGYSSISKSIDLASAYTDARSGYYTKAQYEANYKSGWNDCLDAASSGYYLTGYTTYNGGSKTYLYTAPTGGAPAATGSSQIWRYGGGAVLRYILPGRK